MNVTELTYNVACELMSGPVWDWKDFHVGAQPDEVIMFCHYSFFYTYPQLSFHRVNTFCKFCGFQPQRNYAGVGTVWLLRDTSPDRMSILCDDCRKPYHIFGERQPQAKQLMLF